MRLPCFSVKCYAQIRLFCLAVEHIFEVSVEGVKGLALADDMIWGEADCFVQYHFPTQMSSKQQGSPASVQGRCTLHIHCSWQCTLLYDLGGGWLLWTFNITSQLRCLQNNKVHRPVYKVGVYFIYTALDGVQPERKIGTNLYIPCGFLRDFHQFWLENSMSSAWWEERNKA